MFLQLIDDQAGKTIASVHSREVKTDSKDACATEFELGKMIAEKAKKAKIETVVFDRGGCLYHGRVKAAAEGAREGGLKF
jgi:large subunit ribosomal protein L18